VCQRSRSLGRASALSQCVRSLFLGYWVLLLVSCVFWSPMSSMSSGLLCLLVSYVCYVLCLLCLLVSYVFSSPMSHFTLAHTHTSVLHAAGAWRGTLVRHLCRAQRSARSLARHMSSTQGISCRSSQLSTLPFSAGLCARHRHCVPRTHAA
jgi:hypothetical protein